MTYNKRNLQRKIFKNKAFKRSFSIINVHLKFFKNNIVYFHLNRLKCRRTQKWMHRLSKWKWNENIYIGRRHVFQNTKETWKNEIYIDQ